MIVKIHKMDKEVILAFITVLLRKSIIFALDANINRPCNAKVILLNRTFLLLVTNFGSNQRTKRCLFPICKGFAVKHLL